MRFLQSVQHLPYSLHSPVLQYEENFLHAVKEKQLSFAACEFFNETAPRVWACSDYAATTCIRYPELLLDLLDAGSLEKTFRDGDFQESFERLVSHPISDSFSGEDEAIFAKQLRLFRHQQMIRIAWRDISQLASFSETSQDLTYLADFCLTRGLAQLSQGMYQTFGYPLDEQGQVQQLLIVALGKLGGEDLNFSSDIDLLFIYPAQGETQNGARAISHQVFFTRLAQRLIKLLNDTTSDGFVFRVDMRLRPFGEMGSLVHSYAAIENYYQEQGRDWERYALLKARCISQDMMFKEKVTTLLNRFVYRRYLDYGIIDALRDLKKMMENERRRKRLKHNIKRGAGGIREMEFIIQSLQLVRGGKETRLQTSSFFCAIERLKKKNYLSWDVAKNIRNHYAYLRVLENRLQMLDDRQTQELPKDEEMQIKLGFSMGELNWDAVQNAVWDSMKYVEDYLAHLSQVPTHATQVIESSEDKDNMTSYQNIWFKKIDDAVAERFLTRQGLSNGTDFMACLTQFSERYILTKMSSRARKRLDDLMPMLIGRLAKEPQGSVYLHRVIPILEAISRRSAYLALLLENPNVIDYLIVLCSKSSWLAKEISRYPILLDELLDRRVQGPTTIAALEQELRQLLLLVPEDDLEHQMETLRQFKHSLQLRIANASLVLPQEEQAVSYQLTQVAEVIVAEVMKLAWKSMVASHGYPVSEQNPSGNMQFAVIAYGSFGAYDLSYLSDLDLVFIHNGQMDAMTQGNSAISHQQFYLKIAQKILHLLSTRTLSGTLYELDIRLRPSGSAGLLVSSFSAFAEYQKERAWIWEHQALSKGRFVGGCLEIKTQFSQLREQVLCCQRDKNNLINQIVDMRSKMSQNASPVPSGEFDIKSSPGGLTDLEFMVQYWALLWAEEYPELIANYEVGKIFPLLGRLGIISEKEALDLLGAYKAYKDGIHLAALQEQSTLVEADRFALHCRAVVEMWNSVQEQSYDR